MSDLPAYLPFEGGKPGFKIALAPLERSRWIEPDAHLAERLAEKARLDAAPGADTFRALPGTEAAQREVLAALLSHLTNDHPSHYWRDGHMVHLPKAGACIDLSTDDPALQTAGRLVDDDLCLMIREENGWTLGAASLHFPSHWSMVEKFGRSMADIHAPVPGFAGQMGDRVTRIFDHLQPNEPVWRLNWSLHDDPTLPLPGPTEGPRFEGVEGDRLIARAFLRVERQTLMKLPRSGAILFTIKTYIDPLPALLDAGGAEVTADLIAGLTAMDKAQLSYKGLTAARDRVIGAIRAFAAAS